MAATQPSTSTWIPWHSSFLGEKWKQTSPALDKPTVETNQRSLRHLTSINSLQQPFGATCRPLGHQVHFCTNTNLFLPKPTSAFDPILPCGCWSARYHAVQDQPRTQRELFLIFQQSRIDSAEDLVCRRKNFPTLRLLKIMWMMISRLGSNFREK